MKWFDLRIGRRIGGRAGGRLFAFAIAGFATLLGGCGDDGIIARLLLKPGHIIIERRPDTAYEKLFPYYVELCAASQFRSKLTGEGGIAGHAVMYLKGACKDDDAPYPQLRRCRRVGDHPRRPRARGRDQRQSLVQKRQLGGDPRL